MDPDRALQRDRHRHHQAVRRLHDARLRRRAHVSAPRAAAGRARRLLVLRRRREGGAALADLCGRNAVLQRRRLRHASTRCSGCKACLPFNPQGQTGGRAEPRLQHLGQLHHQHQLAVLRAGNDHELSDADGRAHGAQFRLGGDRHRPGAGADPRLRAARGQGDRQFLGRSDPLHALHPAAALDRRRPVLCLAGHAAESRRLCRCDHARRGEADDRARPGRLAGGDQDARHQWRRVLQRQFGASL